jgi:hypothetical protein
MSDYDYSLNDNKKVTITRGGADWKSGLYADPTEGIPSGLALYLENDFSLTMHQDYEDPLREISEAAKKTKLGSIINSIAGVGEAASLITNIRVQTEYTGAKAWKKSSQLSFDLAFSFYMGMAGVYDGRREVYLPISALAQIFLPKRKKDSVLIEGPGASYGELLSSMGKAVFLGMSPGLNTLVEQTKKENVGIGLVTLVGMSTHEQKIALDTRATNILSSALSKAASGASTGADAVQQSNYNDKTKSRFIGVKIGNLYNFSSILPINFSYSFSKETDDGGFPIYGNCSVHCETMLIATSDTFTGDGGVFPTKQ